MKRSSLILIINFSLLLLVMCIGMSMQIAPYFTCSILAICLIAFLYVLTEQWMTHDAVEFENRFWTLMAFLLAWTCLFCKDSPLRFAEDKPGITWFIVITFTFLAHNYDRHLQRRLLSHAPNIRKVKSCDFGAENRSNAHQKVLELRKLLAMIDNTWMSSTFLNLFFLPKVLYVEHQIISIITEANADELNLIVSNVELGLLFYKVKDHRLARRFNRTNLLKVLCMDRISELLVQSRVILLDGIQRMKLSAHPQSELYVKNIILATKTDDLSELKSLTDCKGDVNSMHKLLYKDIRNSAVKESILSYITQQANIQAAHSAIGSRKGKRRGLFAWRKILSDVDDTVTCSGGSWPAGMDTSYPKKAVYPGVLAFYRELDLGTTGCDDWYSDTTLSDRSSSSSNRTSASGGNISTKHSSSSAVSALSPPKQQPQSQQQLQQGSGRVGNLVFLSARPHVYKSVSESVTYNKFRTMQQEQGLYTSPSLLAGSLDTGSKFMVAGDSEPLALKKYENFREYLALYPEYTCIFIGDNGQGDVRTAEMILHDTRYKRNLHRVYIHIIQPKHLSYCVDRSNTLYRCPEIYYFNTYVDAAIDAYHNKLIRSSGLRKIMLEACNDFLYIPIESWKISSSSASTSHHTVASSGSLHTPGGSSHSYPLNSNRLDSPSITNRKDTNSSSSGSSNISMSGNNTSSNNINNNNNISTSVTTATATHVLPPLTINTTSTSPPPPASPIPSSSTITLPPSSLHFTNSPIIPRTSFIRNPFSSSITYYNSILNSGIPLATANIASNSTHKYIKTGSIPGEGLTAASMGFSRGGATMKPVSSYQTPPPYPTTGSSNSMNKSLAPSTAVATTGGFFNRARKGVISATSRSNNNNNNTMIKAADSNNNALISLPTAIIPVSADMNMALRKRELRMRELNADIIRGNALLETVLHQQSQAPQLLRSQVAVSPVVSVTPILLEPVPTLPFVCRHAIGSTVHTMFGAGTVTDFRTSDGIYEVTVVILSECCLQEHKHHSAALQPETSKGSSGIATEETNDDNDSVVGSVATTTTTAAADSCGSSSMSIDNDINLNNNKIASTTSITSSIADNNDNVVSLSMNDNTTNFSHNNELDQQQTIQQAIPLSITDNATTMTGAILSNNPDATTTTTLRDVKQTQNNFILKMYIAGVAIHY